MAGEWRNVPLGDVADITTGKLDSNAAVVSGRYPFFTCSPETLKIDDYAFDIEAVLLAGNNADGVFAVKYYEGKFNAYQRTYVITTKDRTKLDTKYLYYQLTRLVRLLREYSIGTATKFLTLRILNPLEIPLPSLAEQRAIAHILGTLDDKIELNRCMNETLEAMAQALFKSWFIDFDPVRAKAEGRDPGLPKLLADLFPDSFENSELGEIPKGWVAGTFGSFTSKRTDRVGSREIVVLSAVATGKLVRSDDQFNKQVYSKETHKYLLVEQWDFAYNPSRINIGSVGMLEEPLVGGVSPVYVVARPHSAYQWFLEFQLRCSQTKTWINMLASGSVRQSLSYYDFSSIPSVLPPEPLIQEFNRRWDTLRNGIRARVVESETLISLRNTLLPKLITADLRVRDTGNT